VNSTTVATTLPPATSSRFTSTTVQATTTTHPETVTDDPQTLPATGSHTLGLVMVAGGLIGLGAWFSAYAKRREVRS
jgi:LPXTG-motif cell wall-anchored protein